MRAIDGLTRVKRASDTYSLVAEKRMQKLLGLQSPRERMDAHTCASIEMLVFIVIKAINTSAVRRKQKQI